nr:uncharacterized protein LOC126525933 [Dermacentor andersoni]
MATMQVLNWALLLVSTLCTYAVDASTPDERLEDYFKQKLDGFKIKLHEAFEKARLQRHKRSVIAPDSPDYGALPQDHLRVIGAKPVDLGIRLGNVSCWAPAYVPGSTFLVATTTGQVELLRWANGRYATFAGMATSFTTPKVEAFVYSDQLWIVCLHQRHGGRDHFVRLYLLQGEKLVAKQTIELGGESDIDVVRGASAHYLVTCVFRSYSGSGTSYNGKLTLYQWKNTQFDAVSQHSVVGAKSVVAWSMDGPLYIAVAQQRDNAGELFLGSPVFIYNQRREHELSYVQVIRFWQAWKVNHFMVASIHYLTFLTRQGVFLYWYAGDQFLEWQTLLNTEGAEDVSIFTLPNGEAAIAVVRRDEVMFFLETESSTYNCTFTLKMSGMSLSSVVFQFIEGQFFMFATQAVPSAPQPPLQLVLQKYSFVAQGKPDPLLDCLHGLENSLLQRQAHVDNLAANIGRVWTSNGQKPLATELLVIDGPVKVTGSVSAPKAVIVPSAQRVPTVTPADVSRQIDDVRNGVAKMENDLKNVVFKSVPQTIQGNLNFNKPVSSSTLNVGQLVDSTLNGVPLVDMLRNTLKVTGDQVLNVPVSFSDLYVNNLNAQTINGINISDVMLTNKDQLVTGNLKFGHVSLTDLNIQQGRAINGINPEKIVTTNTPQAIHGRKEFVKLRVPGDLKVTTTTNNHDLSAFIAHLVPLQGVTTVTGEWTFQAPLTVGSALNLKNPINGLYSIEKLYTEAVDKHSHQTIQGPKTYQAPVAIHGNAEVAGTLNGVRPNHDLVTLHTPQNILGTWIVKDSIHFKRNLNAGTVNGLDIAKDAVLRSKGPQVVFGRKIFDSDLVVTKDIAMTPGSTIDGVDPSELGRTAGLETVYNTAVNIESMIVIGNVVAQKGINDHMLRDLQNLIWLKSADQHIRSPVSFNTVHLEKDLDTETINGINLDEDLMRTFGDEVLEGPVVFKDSIHTKGPIDVAPGVKVNGIDLSEAAKLVSSSHQNTVVHGDVSFPSIVVQKDLHSETVNGKPLAKQFLLVNGEQVITGAPSFMKPISVKEVVADFINPVQLNGVPFKAFMDELVLQNGSRHRLISNKHFRNGLEAHHLQSYGLVDGVNVEEMLNSVVLLNVPQLVDGVKVFQNHLRLESLLADKVNGLDIKEHVRRVIRRNVQQVISGKKTVLGKAFVQRDVTTNDLVNGVNMKDLYARAMSKTQENLISAPMTFLGGVDARRLHLYGPAKLDGLDLDNVVLLREDEVLGGTVVFKNLLSDGDIEIGGLLNGCNITKLHKEALYNNGVKQSVYDRKHFSKLNVKGNVHIIGDLNGAQFNTLVGNLIMRNVPQTVDGPVTFLDKVVVDSLTLLGPINGVNLTDLLRDAVTKSTEQVVRGTKTFTNQHGLVASNSLHVRGNVHSQGPVGGIRVADLASVVTAHGRHVIRGKKTVVGPLTVDNIDVKGTLNGLRIPEDLVLPRIKHQRIPGKVILAGPSAIQGNLNLNKVNDLYLEQLLAERVTLSGDQRLRSKLVFRRDVPIHGDLGYERINGILREHLVTQSGEYKLSGAKTFVQDVEIRGNLNTVTVNGYNLVELARDVVLVNRPEEIPHSTVFSAPIEVVGQITVVGTANGIDVQNLKQNFDAGKDRWKQGAQSMVDALRHHEAVLQRQHAAYKGQATGLAYFRAFQTLDIPSRRILTSPVARSLKSPWNTVPADVMILWTAWPTHCLHGRENCCEEFSSEVLNVEPDGALTKGRFALRRRYIPFASQHASTQPGFVVWTNSTSSRLGCERPGAEELALGLLDPRGQFASDQLVRVDLRVTASAFVSDVKMFEFLGSTYLVVAHSFNKYLLPSSKGGHIDVYLFAPGQAHWQLHQTLNATGVASIDVVEFDGIVFLSSANSWKQGLTSSYSTVYTLSGAVNMFVPIADVPTSLASSTLFLTVDNSLLCAFASEKTGLQDQHSWLDAHTEPVSIYQHMYGRFQLLQNIPMTGVNAMEHFRFAGDVFFVLGSRHLQTVAIYQWKGYSKFEQVQAISQSPVALKSYWSRAGSLFLAVATECGKTRVFEALPYGRCISPRDEVGHS